MYSTYHSETFAKDFVVSFIRAKYNNYFKCYNHNTARRLWCQGRRFAYGCYEATAATQQACQLACAGRHIWTKTSRASRPPAYSARGGFISWTRLCRHPGLWTKAVLLRRGSISCLFAVGKVCVQSVALPCTRVINQTHARTRFLARNTWSDCKEHYSRKSRDAFATGIPAGPSSYFIYHLFHYCRFCFTQPTVATFFFACAIGNTDI